MSERELQPEEICRQMQRIRRELPHRAAGTVSAARSLMDWRYYVRRHPWCSLSAAAVLGYLLVPRWRDTACDVARSGTGGALRLQESLGPAAASGGAFNAVAGAAGKLLLRAAAAYLGREVRRHLTPGSTPVRELSEGTRP